MDYMLLRLNLVGHVQNADMKINGMQTNVQTVVIVDSL